MRMWVRIDNKFVERQVTLQSLNNFPKRPLEPVLRPGEKIIWHEDDDIPTIVRG